MKVEIHMKDQSAPVVRVDVKNTYEKGSFFCVMLGDDKSVEKYAIENIFRVIETE